MPGLGALGDYAMHHIDALDWNLTVNNFAINGDWIWVVLSHILPQHICSKIATIKAPSGGAADFPIWKHSSDGFFSIKSAYLHLFQELETEPPQFPFQLIWKLPNPPRINTFLWHKAHNRLMTNSIRFERGLINSDLCPRCYQQPESVMHILRDCDYALELSEKIVDPPQWHRFASLGQSQFLKFSWGSYSPRKTGLKGGDPPS